MSFEYIIVFENGPRPLFAIWAEQDGSRHGIIDGPAATPPAKSLWRSRLEASGDALEFVREWGANGGNGLVTTIEGPRTAVSLKEISHVIAVRHEMQWDSPLFYDPYSGGPLGNYEQQALVAHETLQHAEETFVGHGPGAWMGALRESVSRGLSASGIQAAAFDRFGRGTPEPKERASVAAGIVFEALYDATQDALPDVPSISLWRGVIGGPSPSREMDLLPASSWSLSEVDAERVAERAKTRGFLVGISVEPKRIIAIEPFTRDNEVLISGGRISVTEIHPVDGGGDLIRDPDGGPEQGTADWMRYL